jgi:hypothetical protein
MVPGIRRGYALNLTDSIDERGRQSRVVLPVVPQRAFDAA